MQSSKCTVATMSNDFLAGTSYNGTQFIGLTPAILEIGKLKNDVLSTPNIIGKDFDNTAWVTTDEKAL